MTVDSVLNAASDAATCGHVAMLLHGCYPMDERVKREAEALAQAGYEVDVICLRECADEAREEVIGGVRVIRIPLGRTRSEGKFTYVVDYAGSGVAFLLWLTYLHARRHYVLVQVHTLPDSLAFSALPAKLAGARLVLDIHDLMPELYQSKYSLSSDGWVVRMLRFVERLATGLSDHVVTASEEFRARLIERGVPHDKVTVVLNSADPSVFPEPETVQMPGSRSKYTMFWHGTMVDRYGVDVALDACALARQSIPNLAFVIYGLGECEEALRKRAAELDLDGVVEFRGHVNHTLLAPRIAEADIGVVPNRPDIHIDMAYPTKLFEFVQLGLPVIATRTRVLERRFGEDSIIFCEPSAESLANALTWVYEHPEEARNRAIAAKTICRSIAWDTMKDVYTSCIDATAGRSRLALAENGEAGS
jgi:glycosyltransferase involved in cell wall biosynthesis